MVYKVEPGPLRLSPDKHEYHVYVEDDGGKEIVDRLPTLEEARVEAAIREWAHHFDGWMSSLVEDEDVAENIGEILGLLPNANVSDDDFDKQYNRMVSAVLRLLPAGLRRLADTYQTEWKKLGII